MEHPRQLSWTLGSFFILLVSLTQSNEWGSFVASNVVGQTPGMDSTAIQCEVAHHVTQVIAKIVLWASCAGSHIAHNPWNSAIIPGRGGNILPGLVL